MKWTDRCWIGAGVLMLFFAAIAMAAPDTRPKSGIEGMVTLGPLSPVDRQGVSNERPYQATLVVKNKHGKTVATVQSGADGKFSVGLHPGDYHIIPQSQGKYPRAAEQDVTVRPREYTSVKIHYDTGIR